MMKPKNRWIRLLLLSATLAASSGACTITHEGPQDGTETGNPPVIDATRVMLVVAASNVKITGSAGAVSPGGSEVQVQSSLTGEVYKTIANNDGSFAIEVNASSADIFELRAANTSGNADSATPVYVTRGSAAVSASNLSCMQRDNIARAQVGAVAESADRACESDDDCVLQEGGTVCTDGCNGVVVSMQGARQIEEARSAVAKGICKTFKDDGCNILALPCPGPLPQTPLCLNKQCTVGDRLGQMPESQPSGCSEAYDRGTGDMTLARYWYSDTAKACLPREYSGAGGNANRYDTRAACEAACKPATVSCVAPRVAVTVCLEGGLAGGCKLTGPACALPCSTPQQCAGDVVGSWCANGYCDATSPE